MSDIKQKIKQIWKYVWELFKGSLPAGSMFICASMVLLMLTFQNEASAWDNKTLLWSLACGGAALLYTGLAMWAVGGQHFEMLVSGNIKRTTAEKYGMSYKISSHKEEQEYREWKGFAIGGFLAIFPIITAIIFGCNQAQIDAGLSGGTIAFVALFCFFLSGWTILPFYYMNLAGISVSYFLSGLLGLLPVAVAGAFYIIGAYARRNKSIRQQDMAHKPSQNSKDKKNK